MCNHHLAFQISIYIFVDFAPARSAGSEIKISFENCTDFVNVQGVQSEFFLSWSSYSVATGAIYFLHFTFGTNYLA